jgi:hypothetical protein
MKLSTVAEALAAEPDEPILAIRGKLTKLFSIFKGESEHGDWTLQSGVIKDDSGEIKVQFSNREEVPQNWRGKVIELRCHKGQKGGWSGVKRSIDDRKANVLKVTASAEVFLFEAEHEPEPDEPKPNGHAEPPSTPQDTQTRPPKANTAATQPNASKAQKTTAELMNDGVARMTQIANAQYAAIRIVHEYLVPMLKEKAGITIDAANAGTLVQNLLIQSYYEKVHWNFPDKRFPEPKPNGPPPAEPPGSSG